MTIEPLLRLIAGSLVIVSVLLGVFVDPRVFWFTLFIGANLFQSGISGWCPMMTFLRKVGVRS